MREGRHSRTAPVVLLLLLTVLALVLANASVDGSNRASADTTYNPFPPVYLVASDFVPADGATGVAPNVNISVKFDRDIRLDTLEYNWVTGGPSMYLRQGSSTTDVPATLSYSSVTDRATLNPSADLVPGATYHVTLFAGITRNLSSRMRRSAFDN